MDGSTLSFLEQLREKRRALAAEREQFKQREAELDVELGLKQQARQTSRSRQQLDSNASLMGLYQVSSATSAADLAPGSPTGNSAKVLASQASADALQSPVSGVGVSGRAGECGSRTSSVSRLAGNSGSLLDWSREMRQGTQRIAEIERELSQKMHQMEARFEVERKRLTEEHELERSRRAQRFAVRMNSLQTAVVSAALVHRRDDAPHLAARARRARHASDLRYRIRRTRVDSSVHLEGLGNVCEEPRTGVEKPLPPLPLETPTSVAEDRMRLLMAAIAAAQERQQQRSAVAQWLEPLSARVERRMTVLRHDVQFQTLRGRRAVESSLAVLRRKTRLRGTYAKNGRLLYRVPQAMDVSDLLALGERDPLPFSFCAAEKPTRFPLFNPFSFSRLTTNLLHLGLGLLPLYSLHYVPWYACAPLQSVAAPESQFGSLRGRPGSIVGEYLRAHSSGIARREVIPEAEFYGAEFGNVDEGAPADSDRAQELDELQRVAMVSGEDNPHGTESRQALASAFLKALGGTPAVSEQVDSQESAPETTTRVAHVQLLKPSLPMNNVAFDDVFSAELHDRIGVTVLKIDSLAPVEIGEDEFGTFNLGDSYVVLDTLPDAGGRLQRRIFMWVGPESTPDKRFCASMFATGLRGFLGATCHIEHETPRDESAAFRALFEAQGSDAETVDTAATTTGSLTAPTFATAASSAASTRDALTYGDSCDATEPALYAVPARQYEVRLYELFGQRETRIRLVECSPLSLTRETVFLLDVGLRLYQWNGAGSRLAHRAKCTLLANNISVNERRGAAEHEAVDQDHETDAFFDAMAAGAAPESELGTEVGPDAKTLGLASAPLALYEAPASQTALEATPESHLVGSAFLLSHTLLRSDRVYVLDAGTELFLWSGRRSALALREVGRELLIHVLASKTRPRWTSLKRFAEGSESEVFKLRFRDWPVTKAALFRKDVAMPVGGELSDSGGASAASAAPKAPTVDVRALYQPPLITNDSAQAEIQEQIDALNGLLSIMSVHVYDRGVFRRVSDAERGLFCAQDAYVILCVYRVPSEAGAPGDTSNECVIYFWSGRYPATVAWSNFQFTLRAELEELCASTYQATSKIVRVEEGKEPLALAAHLHMRLAVLDGRRREVMEDPPRKLLFHVQTDSRFRTTRFCEVAPSVRHLVSRDCFLLLQREGTKRVWSGQLWIGKGASRDERMRAEVRTADVLTALSVWLGAVGAQAQVDVTVVEERAAPMSFYHALGHTGSASELVYGRGSEYHFVKPPRFFRCHCRPGHFVVDEVYYWRQMDLEDETVVLFDLGPPFPVYVWIGQQSSDVVRKLARKAVEVYLGHLDDGRSLASPERDFVAWLNGSAAGSTASLPRAVSSPGRRQPAAGALAEESGIVGSSAGALPVKSPRIGAVASRRLSQSSSLSASAQKREGDVIYTFQGREPLAFTSYFLGWDAAYANRYANEPESAFLRAERLRRAGGPTGSDLG